MTQTEPGHPLPFGAYLTGRGVQFSIFSRHATGVKLLLFEGPEALEPSESLELDPVQNRTGDIWHIHVNGLKTGQLYLYRVDGPFDPDKGHRFDPEAWLIDPYAKALSHDRPWKGWKRELMPKCVVVNDFFDWQGDKPLNYPLQECIIYEVHPAGLSKSPSSGVSAPGTFRGIIELIPYFRDLGITSLEFLPLQEFNRHELLQKNPFTGEALTNYWGYSTVAFFAPAAFYASSGSAGGQVSEFKEMVRELHKAGIEVILDIVFNHSAEGNEQGPTISFRGLDNSIYYILDESRRGYMNYSGCGNTMNCNHPIMRSFILDCIRYWVMEMHVDGFRFDLGSILGRDGKGRILKNPPILERLAEDPVLRNTKLIAEAWDAAGTYQVGSFPGGRWAEWNDRFRDDLRRFWRGDPGTRSSLAMRFAGSSDLYSSGGRKPFHSINFITSHDGYTLNDLASYEEKHNEANGENNRDGHGSNFSRNYGVEGPTEKREIKEIRNRTVKNFLASLLLSSGTPMILGGDEFRRSQGGNNNAYCQDNEVSWFDWSLVDKHRDVLNFCRELIKFRRRHPAFRRSDFFSGKDLSLNGIPDITWYSEKGEPVAWDYDSPLLAVLIDGSKAEIMAERDDNHFLLLINGSGKDTPFTLRTSASANRWRRKIDTAADPSIFEEGKSAGLKNQKSFMVHSQSFVLLLSDKRGEAGI
jgi:isoamylase